MTTPAAVNTEQSDYWNADQGEHWVRFQSDYDRMLAPLGAHLLRAAGVTAGARVLDVGCGCGDTTIAAAASAMPGGMALGLDLSVPMTEHARRRADDLDVPAHFDVGDAQVHPFPAGSFDAIVSRFGVMFFDDPVAAFTNLRSALRPGGRLAFVCWQELSVNDWLLVPGAALLEHLPFPEDLDPDAPGPFAFRDAARVESILTTAGFADVAIESVVEPLLLGGGPTLDGTVDFLRQTGFAQRLLDGVAPDVVDRAVAAVRTALAPHTGAAGIHLAGATWLVTARTPT